jgi:sugar/nucleoside kinase (ribokinase family)
MDLLAIGGIALDQIFRVDRLPQQHFEGIIEDFGTYYGGRAPNVAAMVAKLGLKTAAVSAVGDDFASSGYEEHLRKLGVDLRGVIRVPGQKTKQIFIFTDAFGRQITFFHYGAEKHFEHMKVPADLILESRLVHISSSGDFRFNVECAKLAHGNRILVSFDVGNDPFTEIPEYLEGLITCTSFLFMNDVEVDGVLRQLRLKEVSDLLDYGPSAVVIINKQDKSSRIYTKNSIHNIPAVTMTVRDPTGASDGYVAGFLSAQIRGYDYHYSAMLGASEASFTVEASGCQTNLPDWNQLCQRCSSLFGVRL